MAGEKDRIIAYIKSIPSSDSVLEDIEDLLKNRDKLKNVIRLIENPDGRTIELSSRNDKRAAYFLEKIDLSQFPDESEGDGPSIRQSLKQVIEELETLEEQYKTLLS